MCKVKVWCSFQSEALYISSFIRIPFCECIAVYRRVIVKALNNRPLLFCNSSLYFSEFAQNVKGVLSSVYCQLATLHSVRCYLQYCVLNVLQHYTLRNLHVLHCMFQSHNVHSMQYTLGIHFILYLLFTLRTIHYDAMRFAHCTFVLSPFETTHQIKYTMCSLYNIHYTLHTISIHCIMRFTLYIECLTLHT